MALIKCPHCEEMVSEKALCCMKCGYPITARQTMARIEVTKRKNKKVGVLVAVLVAILVGVWVNQNVLFGDDKIAYDIMVTCSSSFKDPASLRLVSGTLGVDKDCLFVRVRAKNGFGAYNTTDYYFSDSGAVLEDEEAENDVLYSETEDFNVEKINRIYARNYS